LSRSFDTCKMIDDSEYDANNPEVIRFTQHVRNIMKSPLRKSESQQDAVPYGVENEDIKVSIEDPLTREHRLWYKEAVFYEVYVRAFFDSNGDGHGDLAGKDAVDSSTSKLLQVLEILMPFNRSHKQVRLHQCAGNKLYLVASNISFAFKR
jgi:hypothetical protein